MVTISARAFRVTWAMSNGGMYHLQAGHNARRRWVAYWADGLIVRQRWRDGAWFRSGRPPPGKMQAAIIAAIIKHRKGGE